MLVAVTALAALQKDNPAVIAGHIDDDLTACRLSDHCSLRNLYDNIFSILAPAVSLSARLAVSCFVLTDVSEIDQRIQTFIDLKDHISAASAVTTVGTARRHIFLAAKGDVTVTALTASHKNSGSVCKHILNLKFVLNQRRTSNSWV